MKVLRQTTDQDGLLPEYDAKINAVSATNMWLTPDRIQLITIDKIRHALFDSDYLLTSHN